jgi:hypothetical protein
MPKLSVCRAIGSAARDFPLQTHTMHQYKASVHVPVPFSACMQCLVPDVLVLGHHTCEVSAMCLYSWVCSFLKPILHS